MALQTKIKQSENGEWKYAEVDGALYFEIYMQCPVCIQNNEPNVPFTYWQHNDCGGSIFIGDNGKYICEKCETSELIALWGYNCPIHDKKGLGTYLRVSSPEVMADVVGVAGQIVRSAGIPWLQRVLSEIEKQRPLFLNIPPQTQK